jgi:hypothetical protein
MNYFVRKIVQAIIVIFVLLTTMACHRSGTWNNDPRNWERAFRSTKPADVVVEHSQFWRSPHFTHEYQYFFHIRRNNDLRTQLFEANRLRKIEGDERDSLFRDYFGDKPSWFIPKASDSYDVWVYELPGDGHFRIFIDRVSRDLFLTDYQV